MAELRNEWRSSGAIHGALQSVTKFGLTGDRGFRFGIGDALIGKFGLVIGTKQCASDLI